MTKKILYIVIATIFLTQASAVDFGGRINLFQHLKIAEDKTLSFNTSDKINLWLASTLNRKANLRLNCDFSYEFRYDTSEKKIRNVLDVGVLKLSTSKAFNNGTTLGMGLGRFAVGDATGVIMNQTSDGLFLNLANRAIDMSAYVGTTILLNTHNVKMILPEDTKFSPKENMFYMPGPWYLPFGMSVKFPELFAGQNLLAEAWGFLDLSNDKYDRFFATVQLAGPIAHKFFYSAISTIETRKFNDISNMSQLMFRVFPSENSSVSTSVLYASGAQGGMKPFTGFTSFSKSDLLAEKEVSSMLAVSLSAHIIVTQNLYLGLEGVAIMGVPDESITFDGVLVRASAIWNIFHDLQLNGGFTGYFAKNTDLSKMKISIGTTFVF